MVKRYEHRHGGMMPVNREVDTYVSSSDYAKLEAERDALRGALEAILNDCESVLDQFYPESIALARTALGDSNG